MKIVGHVFKVSDSGDKLSIEAQGLKVGCAEWRPYLHIAIDVPMSDPNRKAFYIGRRINVSVEPA